MDVLTPVVTGSLLAVFAALFTWIGKTRFDVHEKRFDRLEEKMDRQFEAIRAELRGEIGSVRAEVRNEIGSLRAEVRGEIGSVRAELADIRSTLTQIVLALSPPAQRPQTG